MSRVEAFEVTLLKFIHASANFFHSTAPALNSLLSRITVKLQRYSLKFSAEIIKLPFCSLVCCHVVAKASRNEMRSASVPYVHASLIQRIYPFTREKIPSFVRRTCLLLVVCECCEGFPYKSTKMEGIFLLIMVPVHLSFALMWGKLFSVARYKH